MVLVSALQPRDRPLGRPLRLQVAHRDDLPVRDVRPDLPLRPADHLLDLVHEPVDQPRPGRLRQRVAAGVSDRHITGDRLRIASGQLTTVSLPLPGP